MLGIGRIENKEFTLVNDCFQFNNNGTDDVLFQAFLLNVNGMK